IRRFQLEQDCKAPAGYSVDEMIDQFHDNLPAEFMRFYTETDGGTIRFRQPNQWGESQVTLLPLKLVKQVRNAEGYGGVAGWLSRQVIPLTKAMPERRGWYERCGDLMVIAQATPAKGSSVWYMFGSGPEAMPSFGETENRRKIFRWTGKWSLSAFEPVARTFPEWLEELLDS